MLIEPHLLSLFVFAAYDNGTICKLNFHLNLLYMDFNVNDMNGTFLFKTSTHYQLLLQHAISFFLALARKDECTT